MISIKIPELPDEQLTDEDLREYEKLVHKIAQLPKQARVRIDSYATALADVAREKSA